MWFGCPFPVLLHRSTATPRNVENESDTERELKKRSQERSVRPGRTSCEFRHLTHSLPHPLLFFSPRNIAAVLLPFNLFCRCMCCASLDCAACGSVAQRLDGASGWFGAAARKKPSRWSAGARSIPSIKKTITLSHTHTQVSPFTTFSSLQISSVRARCIHRGGGSRITLACLMASSLRPFPSRPFPLPSHSCDASHPRLLSQTLTMFVCVCVRV